MNTKDRTVQALLGLLEKGNDVHRCFSAQALGLIGDEYAVEPLIARLRDEDEDVVIDAVTSLGQLKNVHAVPALLKSYDSDPSGDVKVAAVEALGMIGGMEVIDPLIDVVRGREEDSEWAMDDEWDDWWDAQLKAVEALGRLGDPKAVGALEEALDDEDSQDLSDAGFRALAGMGYAGAEALIRRLNEGDHLQRRRAARHLSGSDYPAVKEALANGLADADASVCISAAESLASFRDQDYTFPLLNLVEHVNPSVRTKSLDILDSSFVKIPSEKLESLLDDPDAGVRIKALSWVEQEQAAELFDKVSEKLRDTSLEVVAAAVKTLGSLGKPSVNRILSVLLAKQGLDSGLRAETVLALGKLAGKEALPDLVSVLDDADQVVRLNSLRAIAAINDAESLEILLSALRGELVSHVENTFTPPSLPAGEVGPPTVEEGQGEGPAEPEADAAINDSNMEEDTTDDEKDAGKDPGETPEPDVAPRTTLDAIANDADRSDAIVPETEPVQELNEEEQEFLDIAEENIRIGEELFKRQELNPHQDVKRLAAVLLAGKKGEKVVEGLIRALEDPETAVRQAAAETLGRLRAGQSLTALGSMVRSPDRRERIKASAALGNLDSAEAAGVLLGALEDEEPSVAIQHIVSLGKLAEHLASGTQRDELCGKLLKMLEDPETGIRKAAAETLIALDEHSAVPAIIEMAFVDDGNLRLEVGRLMKEYAPDQASEAFLEVLAASDPHHYRVAIEALQEIHRTG